MKLTDVLRTLNNIDPISTPTPPKEVPLADLIKKNREFVQKHTPTHIKNNTPTESTDTPTEQ